MDFVASLPPVLPLPSPGFVTVKKQPEAAAASPLSFAPSPVISFPQLPLEPKPKQYSLTETAALPTSIVKLDHAEIVAALQEIRSAASSQSSKLFRHVMYLHF